MSCRVGVLFFVRSWRFRLFLGIDVTFRNFSKSFWLSGSAFVWGAVFSWKVGAFFFWFGFRGVCSDFSGVFVVWIVFVLGCGS